MKLKKCILAFVMLILSAFCFAGCANIEFIRAIDSQNVIIDKLVIEVDESKINKSGVELKTIMDSINDDLIAFRLSVDKWKEQFDNHAEIKNMIKDGIYVDASIIKNKASIAIQFANWQMFGLFYGYTEVDDFEYSKALEDIGPFVDKMMTEDYDNEQFGLFLIKYSIIRNSGIGNKLTDFTFNNTNYYEKYINMTNNHYSVDDISLSQIFAYPDDRVYNNADSKYVQGGMTFMQWSLDDKPEDFQMEIYKLVPKSLWWYILALVISAIFVIIITVIIVIRYKKNPREKITRWEVEKDGK